MPKYIILSFGKKDVKIFRGSCHSEPKAKNLLPLADPSLSLRMTLENRLILDLLARPGKNHLEYKSINEIPTNSFIFNF